MISVINEIEKRIYEHPEKLLFVFLDIKGNIKESYTYGDFEQRTKNIAAHIYTHYNLTAGDRVLLAYPPGLEMIWAFFACARLGLIPVPVYPPSAQGLDASVQKMNFIARDSGAKAVLTDRSCYWSYKVNSSRNKTGISSLTWIVSDPVEEAGSISLPDTKGELLFLQYTSGSTSDPKGVMVTHANIIENCNNVVDHLPISVSWLPQYHDMGLIGYYLFFALKGGTTYGFSPSDFIQRPVLWLEAITKFMATASSAPNFAYEYCLMPGKIPESALTSLDLSSLKLFMTASEPIKPDVFYSFQKKFQPLGLNPESYFGAYGLAEFTLAVTNYGRTSLELDADYLKQGQAKLHDVSDASKQPVSLMSCGKALHDTNIKIVNTDAGNIEVAEGYVGEIWLDGASKCKGYWNRPELTREVFEAETSGTTCKKKWLRTGDLGFLYANELYVCGRIKDLIIIRGLNYYPQDIEAIVEQDPLVRKGCVAAFSIENSDDQKLVVVAGIKSPAKVPDAQAIHNKINQFLGISISEIIFIPARAIPKTSSGKIRRSECRNKYMANEFEIISQIHIDQFQNEDESTNKSEINSEENKPAYHLFFNRYNLTGLESATLGNCGLDSLKLAEFGHDLKSYLEKKGFDDLSHEVDLKLLQRIAASELFAILQELDSASRFARFKFRKAFAAIRAEYEKSEIMLMVRDSVLQASEQTLIQQNNSYGAILLTGGTGFFGPFLVNSLLEQTGDNIYVLVRAGSVAEGKNRLREAFNTINPTDKVAYSFESRVKPVCGDLSKPKLGVSDEDWNFLLHDIHTIYHNGAYVNYLMDYESVRQINVGGTREVIKLARTVRTKILNHISTTFIFGWSVKETLYENDCNADMEFLDFGYSQSKWVSDQLVLKAMDQGVHTRIFRPALISPSLNGHGYNFDISIRLLSFMLKYGIGTNAKNQVSFTPADLAANNIVAISNLDSSLNKTFHVTRDEYATMQEVTDVLGTLAGKSFKNYDLKAFVPEVVRRCKKQDLLFPLLNFLVRSVDNISNMEFKRYDNSNYMKFRRMSLWGKEDPPLKEVVKGIYLFMKQNTEIADSLKMESVTTPELINNLKA